MSVKFIHTADIHLGSIIHTTGEPNLELQEKFDRAVIKSFERVCDIAVNNKVDFIVISGDLFDSDERSIRAVNVFNKEAERLKEKGIVIYLITGNHDPSYNRGGLFTYPDNVYVFDSSDVEIKDIKDENSRLKARLLGQSYRGKSDSRKMYSFFTPPDRGVVNIGLLHTQLDPDNNNYVPCSLQDILNKDDIDYWALGHIHQNQILNQEKPAVVYPGIPQGRDFGETGPGGCYLVEFEGNKKPKIEFVPTSSLIWQEIDINITEEDQVNNLDEIKSFLIDKADDFTDKIQIEDNFLEIEGYLLRWNITKKGDLTGEFSENKIDIQEHLLEELREELQYKKPFIWSEGCSLEIEEKLPTKEELKEYSSVFEEIFEVSEQILKDEKLFEELKDELGDIWQGNNDRENSDEYRFNFPDNADEIIEKAKKKIMEEFWKNRGE